jgi:hypothetical protein
MPRLSTVSATCNTLCRHLNPLIDFNFTGISSICLPGFKIKRIRFNIDVEMEQDDDEVQPQWDVGTILEAEMMDPKFVVYYGTIHPVRVVRAIPETNDYECALLAFGGVDTDLWDASLLHVPRDGQPRILLFSMKLILIQ